MCEPSSETPLVSAAPPPFDKRDDAVEDIEASELASHCDRFILSGRMPSVLCTWT